MKKYFETAVLVANILVIEVGRLCNRICLHCLRGPMEDITISLEQVKLFLSQFSRIGSITFTGGEPTLYAKEISEIIDYIIENKIEVSNFYIASNGQEYSHELMSSLIKFYAYIDDNECTAYDVSSDQFHEPKPDVIRKLQAFSFFQQRSAIAQTGIIAEGYAVENEIGYRHLDHAKKFYVSKSEWPDESVEYEIDVIYLNALGYIYSDCDFSYATQRAIDAPHCERVSIMDIILDDSLSDIHG